MMASLADSATDRKRPSDSRSACSIRMPAIRRPTWRPMCEATSSSRSSGLTALTEKHSITAKVSSAIGIGNEKPPRRPDRGRLRVAREVGVARDVDDPLRAAALEHAAREADAARERRALGVLAEALEARRVGEIPEPRREQLRRVLGAAEIDVADRPARPAAQLLDAGHQHAVDGLRATRRVGDALDQAHQPSVGPTRGGLGTRPRRPCERNGGGARAHGGAETGQACIVSGGSTHCSDSSARPLCT